MYALLLYTSAWYDFRISNPYLGKASVKVTEILTMEDSCLIF